MGAEHPIDLTDTFFDLEAHIAACECEVAYRRAVSEHRKRRRLALHRLAADADNVPSVDTVTAVASADAVLAVASAETDMAVPVVSGSTSPSTRLGVSSFTHSSGSRDFAVDATDATVFVDAADAANDYFGADAAAVAGHSVVCDAVACGGVVDGEEVFESGDVGDAASVRGAHGGDNLNEVLDGAEFEDRDPPSVDGGDGVGAGPDAGVADSRLAATLVIESEAVSTAASTMVSLIEKPASVSTSARVSLCSMLDGRPTRTINVIDFAARMTAGGTQSSQKSDLHVCAAGADCAAKWGPHRPKLVPAPWPPAVRYLHQQLNPLGIEFESVLPFSRCVCIEPCGVYDCANARAGVYCTPATCNFSGAAVIAFVSVLQRNVGTHERTVVATQWILDGIIVGEYVGKMRFETDKKTPRNNSGYALQVKARSTKQPRSRVIIDAARHGGLTRFMNHSCEPNAVFVEVGYRRHRTVVVATTRDIAAGEEVCVDYGSYLWFLCACGESTCRHRHYWCRESC